MKAACAFCNGPMPPLKPRGSRARFCSRTCQMRAWRRRDNRGVIDEAAAAALREIMAGHVEVAATGCWLWTGYRNQYGYGKVGVRGDPKLAHRVSYEIHVGPIPTGLELDHLCRVRHCVNPAHLEPVTPRENTLRGFSIAGQNARKTHCKHGHPFDEENTYLYNGKRHCRACGRVAGRESDAQQKELLP